jgi:hypothetical protein
LQELQDLRSQTTALISHNSYQSQFLKGTRTFQKLFTMWMDTNGWSHPVMTSLAKSCLDGASWFHSSQISGLRQQKLLSPGPRIFCAIERLNYYIWRYKEEKKLLPNTKSSNDYKNPYPILEDGMPPSVGWWVEVFVGTRIPKDIDLDRWRFSESQAESISKKWGRAIRNLLTSNNFDLIDDLSRAIRENYPPTEEFRVQKLKDVIRGQGVWDGEELELELPALAAMSKALGGPDTENALLDEIG